MTEAEWLKCDDPKAMFARVQSQMSTRQSRLISYACGRRFCHIWDASAATDEYYQLMQPAVDASCQAIIRAAEDLSEEWINRTVIHEFLAQLDEHAPFGLRSDIFLTLSGNAASWMEHFTEVPQKPRQQGMLDATELQTRVENNRFGSALLREIVGNPFRPVTFAPEWRTDTTTALTWQMYESRDFSAMPILADALQDAGCENEDVLNHCRDPQQAHVRGCWVVDAVLGKA